MNLDKVKKKLRKINSLYSAMEEDGMYSSIEKDLLKSYVQRLYEEILSEEHVKDEKVSGSEKKKDEVTQVLAEKIKPVSTDEDKIPVHTTNMDSIFAEEPIENSTIRNRKAEAVSLSHIEVSTNGHHQEKEAAKVVEQEVIDEIIEDPEVDVLFREEHSNELSNKLSKLPIKDLKLAMGLNERIFTINELFNGDKEHFGHTLEMLNSFNGMKEAREYLTREVIHRYQWLDDKKFKKASNFIKVISRRYLK